MSPALDLPRCRVLPPLAGNAVSSLRSSFRSACSGLKRYPVFTDKSAFVCKSSILGIADLFGFMGLLGRCFVSDASRKRNHSDYGTNKQKFTHGLRAGVGSPV